MPSAEGFFGVLFYTAPCRGDQRGRGRSGGRAVSGRGRMPEARAERRRHVAQEIAAHGQRPSSLNARSRRRAAVASCFALWINACTVSGQIRISFPSLAIAFAATARSETRVPWRGRMLARIVAQTRHGSRKKTTIYWGTLAPRHA